MTQRNTRQTLRQLPLAVGILGGSLLLINRCLTPELTSTQSRSDALGILLSALLILTGLIWQQIQPRLPDAVSLVGHEGCEFAPNLAESIQIELAWASKLLLTNTVTGSLIVWYDGQVLLRRGVLGSQKVLQPGPIVERVLAQQKPVYLVDLKLYPGRIEFNYLPENTQGVICQPLGSQGVLILGANAPRSYTQQDERWIEGIAEKLTYSLSTAAQTQS